MLQVARLSPRVLGESTELVAAFLRQQLTPSGGFRDRAGAPDLYYTVFGLEGLIALHHDPLSEQTKAWLRSFGHGASLDFVHLTCLARAWATMSRSSPGVSVPDLLAQIESFRAADGGYNPAPHATAGTAYGAFLAVGAYQDLGSLPPGVEQLLTSLDGLRAADGAYGNQPGMPAGQTSATAAAIAVQRQLGRDVDPALGDWLVGQVHPQGGFIAAPAVPMPDLLSTATALHALATLQRPLNGLRELCLDFVDSLWTNRGGFYGSWADDHLDCEYTYYGLLALGHLSV